MEKGMMAQPYVVNSKVTIDRKILVASLSRYGYCSLNEKMLSATVSVEYEGTVVEAKLGWIEELAYPLMRIIRIDELKRAG